MKRTLILISFAIMQLYHLVKPDSADRVNDRIQILKDRIRANMKNKYNKAEDPSPAYDDFVDNSPIKPILNEEIREKEERYKFITAKSKPAILRTSTTRPLPRLAAATPSGIKGKPKHPSFSLDIFYRKAFDLSMQVDWLHCSDLVTPYVQGIREPNKWPAKIGVKDPIVSRLIFLLSTNTTKFGRSEKRTLMYQISKLKLRLYHWNINAMYAVLTTISKSRTSDFGALKTGMKALFAAWNTDLTNTTALLLQSKVYRPPCVVKDNTGSSKFVRGSTIPSPSTLRSESQEECRRRGLKNC